MIKTGLCSVTLAQKSAEEVIRLASDAGLQGIEWWGGEHVPPGDFEKARLVRDLSEKAGLEISGYGSYYRTAVSEGEGLSFASVLRTAEELGAPAIRIWAGNCDYAKADRNFIDQILVDTERIAAMAGEKGIDLVFEFHGGTLTDSNETALKFAGQVKQDNVRFSWQPPHGYPVGHCLSGLEGLLDRLATLHVYHWTIGSYERNTLNELVRPLNYPEDFFRHPLADGADRWREYFDLAKTTGRDHFALLEFVRDDSAEQFLEDAAVLRGLV